ncbi:hypothetical protein [Pajaroellobacter abortibovis]|nr:hypothetical protein [Pajaroellobacter abortibovis]
MLETLIVIPTFIVFFAGINLLTRRYQEKLTLMQSTREKAWTSAIDTCVGQQSEGSIDTIHTVDPKTPSGVDPRQIQQDINNIIKPISNQISETDSFSKDFGSITVTQSFNSAGDPTLGASPLILRNSYVLMCNEIPEDGDLFGMVKAAWHYLTNW